MNEEATYICKRLIDLSRQANRKGIVTFSDFLTINEQSILKQNKEKLEFNMGTIAKIVRTIKNIFIHLSFFLIKKPGIKNIPIPATYKTCEGQPCCKYLKKSPCQIVGLGNVKELFMIEK